MWQMWPPIGFLLQTAGGTDDDEEEEEEEKEIELKENHSSPASSESGSNDIEMN